MGYLDHVVGQTAIKNHLTKRITEGTLPHSILLYGEPGLGQVSLAIGLASMLLGRQVFSADAGASYLQQVQEARSQEGDKKATEGLPIYVDNGEAFWIRPMKATLKVEQWYQLLQQYLGRCSDGRTVVIVEGFQTATAVLANAMLKTIEEPPPNTYFIIVTDQRSTVLPTIVSRCMMVPLAPVPADTMTTMLQAAGYSYGLEAIVAASHGNPTVALNLAKQGTIPLLELAMDTMERLGKDTRPFTQIMLRTQSLGATDMQALFGWLRTLGRDMMAIRHGVSSAYLQCPLFVQRLVKLLPLWTDRALQTLLQQTLDAEEALRLHVKPSLVMNGVLLALLRAVKEDAVDDHSRRSF